MSPHSNVEKEIAALRKRIARTEKLIVEARARIAGPEDQLAMATLKVFEQLLARHKRCLRVLQDTQSGGDTPEIDDTTPCSRC